MITLLRVASFVAVAQTFFTAATAQDYPGSYRSRPPIPAPIPARSVSGVGAWRYDQALSRHYEAVSRRNQVEFEKAAAEVAMLRAESRDQQVVQSHLRLEEARDRLRGRKDRAASRAQQLWEQIQADQVDWPLALQRPWFQERIEIATAALEDRYASHVAKDALAEIRESLPQRRWGFSKLERDRAFRVLVLLEGIAKQRSADLLARR